MESKKTKNDSSNIFKKVYKDYEIFNINMLSALNIFKKTLEETLSKKKLTNKEIENIARLIMERTAKEKINKNRVEIINNFIIKYFSKNTNDIQNNIKLLDNFIAYYKIKLDIDDMIELINKNEIFKNILARIEKKQIKFENNQIIDDFIETFKILTDKNFEICEDLEVESSDYEYNEFGKKYDGVKMYLSELNYKVLTADEEKELFIKYKNGNENAREEIINHNLKLVVKIARRYCRSTLPFLDLIQEGNIGLMKAVEKFDYTKGFKFSTYASWWIRQGITRSIADQGRNIRVPVYVHEEIIKLKKFIEDYKISNFHNPSETEMANFLDCSINKIRDINKYMQDCLSLNQNINTPGDSSDSELEDFVPSSNNLEEESITKMISERFLEIILKENLLTNKELMVIEKRYGIGTENPMTLDQIGKELGVTRERIRQIQLKAEKKLKRNHKLREFVEDKKCIK